MRLQEERGITCVLQLFRVLLGYDAWQVQNARTLQQKRSRSDQLLNGIHGFEEARLDVTHEQRGIRGKKARKHRIL